MRSRWVVDRGNSFQWGDVASELWFLRALMSSTPKVSIAVYLIARVRRREDGRATVPAMVVSAYERTKDRHRAFAEGFDACCAQTLDRRELAEAVTEALAAPRPSVRVNAVVTNQATSSKFP